MQLYPLILKLKGHRCVVVGGGLVAERKIGSLLACGANVKVVALECSSAVREHAEREEIELIERAFEPNDLDGARLVIAATNVRAVNEAITAAGHERGILVNVVDVPDLCDFYVPATIKRGDVLIAISTSGSCPALAKRLRQELETKIGPEYEAYAGLLATLRQTLKARVTNSHRRVQAEDAFLNSEAFTLVHEGNMEAAEQLMEEYVARYELLNESHHKNA